jgi:hypothetical protein
MADSGEVRFSVVAKWRPNLGPHEEPYAVLLWIGGLEHTIVSHKLVVVPGQAQNPLLEFVIPPPKGHRIGTPFLAADVALMAIPLCVANSEDDSHRHKRGVNEAGTACFPLRKTLSSKQGSTVATQEVKVYNALVANPNYHGNKGELEITFGQPTFPMGNDPWLPEDEFTVDHEAEFNSPLIQAVIQASMHFGINTQCRFKSIQELPGLPPYQFHQYFIPGQMMAAKRNSAPMKEKWWTALMDMGIQRSFPNMTLESARMYLAEMGSEREKMVALMNAAVTPCNYWRYYPDQTEDKDLGFVSMEAFGLTSRAKCGIVNDQFYTPLQDCEDDEQDIEKIVKEFQSLAIHNFKSPLLRQVQAVSQDYVFAQALCGVNGGQLSDGQKDPSGKVDPYASLGGHEVGILMRKSTFVKLLGKLNKNRPLFDGWASQYNPDAPLVFPEDQPMIGEGTGDVDPAGGGYRSTLLEAYRYLMVGNKTEVFKKWKMPQWQNIREVNDFYRCFLSFVIPELYELGYANGSFTAMTFDPKTKAWTRGFSYQDLMRPHSNIGLRMDPGMNETQAKTVKRVASFYPIVEGYTLPGPAAKCPVRSKLQTRMDKITETMKSLKRVVPRGDDSRTLVADFYPTYYQCTRAHIQAVCEMIVNKPNIVDVTVKEEAVHTALGGFRVAFTVNMTSKPKQLIRQLEAKMEGEALERERNPLSLADHLATLQKLQATKRAFWNKQ